jgi:hypothetical protein
MAGDDDGKSGVAAFLKTEAGFDLNAGQLPSVLHQNVVRIAVAVRPRDANAFAGGAQHESKFGEITHAPGAEVSGGHVGFACFQLGPRGQLLVVSC